MGYAHCSVAASMADGQIFSSFWMAGLESACHVNSKGVRLDMIHATQHDRFIDDYYANLLRMRIRSAREAVRWHLVGPTPGAFDFESMDLMIEAARRHGIQLVWDCVITDGSGNADGD